VFGSLRQRLHRRRAPRAYMVSPEAFYSQFPPSPAYRDRVEDCIAQLVRRYGLVGKTILSVGAGAAHEEFFLHRAGNTLILVDIDEGGIIEPRLANMPKGDMCYIIGDAGRANVPAYDVAYFSSFTPDELRRAAIMHPTSGPRPPEWPADVPPFHPTIGRFARKLQNDGLLIIQSYAGSLDVLANPAYVPACSQQLADWNLRLTEVYRFTEVPGVMLYVAHGPRGRIEHEESPLTSFHGRSELGHRIERMPDRLWHAGDGPSQPGKAITN
jgi:hypothetical protein